MLRYESYKPSGIQWVEKVPSHWGVERAKWLFNRMERPVRPEDDVVTAFRDGQVTLRTNRRTEGFTNAIQEHGYQGIRKGDLVIHAMDAFAGAIGVSDSDGKSTPVYAACVPRGEYPVNSHYYAYLLRYMAHSGYIESLSKGIRERSTDFRFTEFRELSLPIPDKDEQDGIVAFLDQKTAEIDAAIAKKQRLIDLLGEQKDLLVSQAVLAGLNSEAATRPCEIDGICSIPSHWKVVANRHLFREKAKKYKGEALPPLSLSQKDGLVPTDEMKERSLKTSSYEHFRICRAGDLVLNRFKAHLGVFFAAKQDGVVTFHYGIYTPELGVSSKYFELLFHTNAFRAIYAGASNGMTVGLQNLSNQNFYDVKSICPPCEEQVEIVNYVIDLENRYAALTLSIEKELASLRELKKLAVANAVTGQIKV